MCMRNVNITTSCYKGVTHANGMINSLDVPFNGISVPCENGAYVLDNFVIVTNINVLGTNDEAKKADNILERKGKLNVIIRLTKCSKDENSRLGIDLDSFTIDFADHCATDMQKACFPFYNYIRVTNVDKIDLKPGCGKYVIKVLVSDELTNEHVIQAMYMLDIKSSE